MFVAANGAVRNVRVLGFVVHWEYPICCIHQEGSGFDPVGLHHERGYLWRPAAYQLAPPTVRSTPCPTLEPYPRRGYKCITLKNKRRHSWTQTHTSIPPDPLISHSQKTPHTCLYQPHGGYCLRPRYASPHCCPSPSHFPVLPTDLKLYSCQEGFDSNLCLDEPNRFIL
jgi:hypothetical protein